MTFLVAKFRSRREAHLAALLIKNMKQETEVLNKDRWEDFYLAEMIDEGMKEKGTVPLREVRKKLKG